MLNRKKRYRVLVSGYWMREEERGHFSAIVNTTYNRLNATRKTKLENKFIALKCAENVLITGFEVQP